MWVLGLALLLSFPAYALPVRVREGDLQAIAQLADAKGRPRGEGRFTQRWRGDELHVESRYDLADGSVVVERAVFHLEPSLEQLSWFREERNRQGGLTRSYDVDFRTRRAHAAHYGTQDVHWADELRLEPGRTFAGIGLEFAVKNLRDTLKPGAEQRLKVIAFTPKPRLLDVVVRHGRVERLLVAGRRVAAEHFTLKPLKGRATHVWLYQGGPPAVLRVEAPAAEQSDAVVRIDRVPGTPPRTSVARRTAPKRRTHNSP